MRLPILLKKGTVLLIGGGNVAYQKAIALQQAHVSFCALSITFKAEFLALGIPLIYQECTMQAIQGYDIIIDATGMPSVAAMLCVQPRPYLLNVVDNPPLCDFYFTANIHRGELSIAISSNGASPFISKLVKKQIDRLIPQRLENILYEAKIQRAQHHIDTISLEQQSSQALSKVFLIGCGSGDVELLTLKAYKLIKSTDVALVDSLVTQEIVELLPKHCKIINVGKKKGKHTLGQEEINALILRECKHATIVSRLKCGDPFIFGRGAEEALFLMKHHIDVEIIPGITSAISAPLSAGIPITYREVASSFSVVSAHKKNGVLDSEWLNLLRIKNHSVVLLMGLSVISDMQHKALSMGIDAALPVAFIQNATHENQKVVISTLKEMHIAAQTLSSPTVIVFGECVTLSDTLPHYIHSHIHQLIGESHVAA